MQTLTHLKRRIDSVEDLHTVVRTMKSLAAVNIRQYENAAEALSGYAEAIDMALGVALRRNPESRIHLRRSARKRIGAVVFGSDQGMCGPLNERVVSHALETLEPKMEKDEADPPLICAGDRASGLLADAGLTPGEAMGLPGALSAVTAHVGDMLLIIEKWREEKGVDHVVLFHARQESRAAYTPRTVHLLPLDAQWLEARRQQRWDSTSIPFFTMKAEDLFSALIREYLFIGLFRAFVDSLASENAARLAAMQGAENNIAELQDDLKSEYHQLRQMSITEELLDIVSGFEALKQR